MLDEEHSSSSDESGENDVDDNEDLSGGPGDNNTESDLDESEEWDGFGREAEEGFDTDSGSEAPELLAPPSPKSEPPPGTYRILIRLIKC